MADILQIYSGTSSDIDNHNIENGSLYLSTDKDTLSIDQNNSRHAVKVNQLANPRIIQIGNEFHNFDGSSDIYYNAETMGLSPMQKVDYNLTATGYIPIARSAAGIGNVTGIFELEVKGNNSNKIVIFEAGISGVNQDSATINILSSHASETSNSVTEIAITYPDTNDYSNDNAYLWINKAAEEDLELVISTIGNTDWELFDGETIINIENYVRHSVAISNGKSSFLNEIVAINGIVGNASTASAFNENKVVELVGDVTGSEESTGGWLINTSLSASGVTAGTYGDNSANNATVAIPKITVDNKGRITSANDFQVTVPVVENIVVKSETEPISSATLFWLDTAAAM